MELKFSHVTQEAAKHRNLLFCVFSFESDGQTTYFRLSEDTLNININFFNNVNLLSHLLIEIQCNRKHLKDIIKKELKNKRKELKQFEMEGLKENGI